VVALVTRQPDEGRTVHESLGFSVQGGADGDRWSPGKKGTSDQVTAMESGVGQIIANGQSLALFGDNLILDLALDARNLPAGSRIRIGDEPDGVELEVTAEPHTGCHKYMGRFGAHALGAISRKDRRQQNLRGIHLRVVRSGTARVGDVVRVLERGPGGA